MPSKPVVRVLIARAVVAALLSAGVALPVSAAPDKSETKRTDKTRVPQTVPATTPPGTVTLDKMDDATQKNLGRGAVSTAPANPTAASGSTEVRDWAGIDSNHDQSISPAEMEAFLVVAHAKAASGK
jgi:hypothetical protein